MKNNLLTQKITIKTPIGYLTAETNQKGITRIFFEDEIDAENHVFQTENPILASFSKQMKEYFSGKRKVFTFKIEIQGTEFQQKVWQTMLKEIKFGQTVSYKQLAQMIDKPKAIRAVANANARNNLPIVIPCHRVIGTNGKLTGFRGGLWRKKILLELENKEFGMRNLE